jgi:threonine dehydrogenase-like Zn-dependent dehydrogenase
MAGTMRAFVIKKVGETGIVEKPIPEPGPEEAIVKTTAALICTSDVHTVKATSRWASSTSSGRRSPGSRRASASRCAR